jgi:hypothetical protein
MCPNLIIEPFIAEEEILLVIVSTSVAALYDPENSVPISFVVPKYDDADRNRAILAQNSSIDGVADILTYPVFALAS